MACGLLVHVHYIHLYGDVEHLRSLDTLSSSSSIDLEQVEEDYLRKTKRSRYEVIYNRKKSSGEKTIADNDKSFEKQPIEKEDQGSKSKEDGKLAD